MPQSLDQDRIKATNIESNCDVSSRAVGLKLYLHLSRSNTVNCQKAYAWQLRTQVT